MQFSSRTRIPILLLLHILILLSSLIAVSNAFSLDRLNKKHRKHRNRNLDIERNSINAKCCQLVPVFISVTTLTLGYPGSASAMAMSSFNNNVPNEVVKVVAANLADTDAFKKLPLERTYSGAIKEIRDQQDLQDDRLHECATKGKDWEQCFWFGQSNDGEFTISTDGSYRGRMDSQLVSPAGILTTTPTESNKIPTW